MSFAPALLFLVRAAMGCVFVVSGFQKLSAPAENFAAVIEKFEILRGLPVTILAQTLPWAEFIAGVFLVLGLRTRLSLFILWVMNTIFIGILASALLRKLPIQECGCFGKAVSLSIPQMLAVDVSLWVFFLVYFLASRRIKVLSLDGRIDRRT